MTVVGTQGKGNWGGMRGVAGGGEMMKAVMKF